MLETQNAMRENVNVLSFPCKDSPGVCLPHLLPKQNAGQKAVSRQGQTQQLVLGCSNLLCLCHPDRLLALPCAASFPPCPVTASLPAHRQKGCAHPPGRDPSRPGSSMPTACSSAWSGLLPARGPQRSEPCVHAITSAGVRAQQARFPTGRSRSVYASHLFPALQRFQL